MKSKLQGWLVRSWTLLTDGRKINQKTFISGDREEINSYIDVLPSEQEYEIWERVWRQKL